MKGHEETAGERERKLAEAIIKVRAGEMTARAAARSLSISPKTYYKWEKRALQGLMGALREQPGGRQAPPRDPEKEELKRERDRWRREAPNPRTRRASSATLVATWDASSAGAVVEVGAVSAVAPPAEPVAWGAGRAFVRPAANR